MLGIHILVILTIYCFYAAYAKARQGKSGRRRRTVPVFCAAFFLRLIPVVCLGDGELWLRVPVLLCELLTGVLLYGAVQKEQGENPAFWFLGLYLLNPALILNGTVGNPEQTLIPGGICFVAACLLMTEKAGAQTRLRCLKAGAILSVAAGLLTMGQDSIFLYPALILLLFCWVYTEDSRFFDCYTAFSVCFLYKTAYFHVIPQTSGEGDRLWLTLISLLTAASALYFFRALLVPENSAPKEYIPEPGVRGMKFEKKDLFLIGGICLLYGFFGLGELGIRETPETEYAVGAGESIVLELEEALEGGTVSWYLKDSAHHTVTMEFRNSEEELWQSGQELAMERVFCWGSSSFATLGKYVRLTNQTGDMTIGELVIQNGNGDVVTPVNAEAFPGLFDESGLLPEVIDYRSGTYFDESYYTRTAYELLNGEDAYEKTHPPLGKILIALGAACFGTSPFGFRIVGAVFGILMLPFLYLLGRDMTKSRLLGAFACFLFAFDFMHFTQTRIATIDVFVTFLTILMFYFMYQYSRMSFYDTSLLRTFLPLGACGVSFGLGIACKWTGFYAGAGLAALFFGSLYRRYREYVYARERPGESSNGIAHSYITEHFRRYAGATVLFCIVFFVVVPFVIYLLSYLPFSDGTADGLLVRMWRNQKYMFSFHTGLEADHLYASDWYQWPLMIRPVFYYSRIIDDSMRQGISAFGNPLVWWAGIPAACYMLYLCLKRGDKNALFLSVAYGFCYLPWYLVSRCTFAYHYFPSVPFVACMIAYSFAQWKNRRGSGRIWIAVLCYSAAAFGLFLLFYPVLSGRPVSADYVSRFLRWMDTWVLVQ